MLPTYREGRIVIGSGWFRELKPGDVVIISHDGREKIKRIQEISKGQLFVVGDNPAASTDSRSFGWLPLELVRAKVIWPRL
jgi:phage repressor protein C with HTH and peptisase S24 domain